MSRQPDPQEAGPRNVNPLTAAQEKMDAVRDWAQRQLATVLANGFGTLAMSGSANEATVSGTSNQAANGEQEGDNLHPDSVSIKSEDSSECECGCESLQSIEIKEEIETQTKMVTTAGTSIISSNIDNVSVNRETESTNSESMSNDEVEITGSQPTDETMRHSECEQVNNMEAEETQDLSGIINFVAINLPRPLVPYESSDEEEDDNERENLDVDVDTVDDQIDVQLPSMNNAAHSMTASTSTNRHRQSPSKVSFSGTSKKVKQPRADASSTAEPKKQFKIITKRLNCPQVDCPKVCKSKRRLNVHLKTKHDIEQFRCLVSKCDRSFIYNHQLSDHLRTGHGKRSKWHCGLCSTSFPSHAKLHSHIYSQHAAGLFECSVEHCTYKATTRGKVANHQLWVHATAKHTCPVVNCGRSFRKKYTLQCHLRLHTQERPYACDQCDKAYARRETLNSHLRLHAGRMRARCTWPDCNYQAIAQGNVVTHIRTVHYGLPPTAKKQAQLGIIDTRNAYDFMERI